MTVEGEVGDGRGLITIRAAVKRDGLGPEVGDEPLGLTGAVADEQHLEGLLEVQGVVSGRVRLGVRVLHRHPSQKQQGCQS